MHKNNISNVYFTCVGLMIGITIGATLIYLFQGFFPYEVVIGGFFGITLYALFHFIKTKSNKSNLVEVDERMIKNLMKMNLLGSHILIIIIYLGISLFTLLDYSSVPIIYLWILLFIYIWCVSITSIIIKRR